MGSIKRAKSEAAWLKSEGPLWDPRKNQIWLPVYHSGPLPPLPLRLPLAILLHASLFILQWICHSALKYSWLALKNKCVCRKEQKLKRKKLVVLRDALWWWKWQRATTRVAAPGLQWQHFLLVVAPPTHAIAATLSVCVCDMLFFFRKLNQN